jgi:hypothetical protein
MDMIFTETDWQLYFRLFCYELMLGIEVDGYSHEFWKSMKRMSEGKSYERIGDCCFEISGWTDFKGYGECDTAIEFIFLSMKTHPSPSQEGEKYKKEVLV